MSITAMICRLNRRDQPILKLNSLNKTLLLIALVIFSFIYVKNIIAQENPILETQKAIQKGNNQEAWLDNAMGSNLVSLTNLLVGTLPEATYSLDEGEYQQPTSWIPGGAVGTVSQMIASLYNPPASGIEYLAQVKNEFLGKPAYAQSGLGWSGLQPLLPIWRVFRNVIYIVASLFLIILGIMIMLRIRINPQTVITIQNTIPKVIITLILVTFSYAIAGLLIDLMYFVQAAGIYLMFQIKNTDINQSLLAGNNNFWALNQASLSRHFGLIWKMVPSGLLMGLCGLLGAVLTVIGTSTFGPLGLIGLLIPFVLVAIFLLAQVLSLLLGLIKSYFSILMSIVFAPFIIGAGAFPNSKTGFESWLKQFLANLAVFPAVYLFLILVNVLISMISEPGSTTTLWAPGIISFATPYLSLVIGIAAIMIIAKIPTILPLVLSGSKPSPWGQALTETAQKNIFVTTGRMITPVALHSVSDHLKERIWGTARDETGDERGDETTRKKKPKPPHTTH
ncbi:MAG TPA: hypothetical protein PK131_00375 [Candidatus Woesebacteria bacterium]|nr:hypothetical protein [Candidatus Woesebacteria bacterium]HRT40078.1 hypothetical protein [Candidatus Woesebacteria bacterium]